MKRRDFLQLSPDQRRAYFQKEVAGKVLKRSFTITREVDEENRTVSLSFSSDEPYDRYFYSEILSHDKKAILLDRLNDGGALLSDHDWQRQIGVVVAGTAKTDGHVARCDVKFSTRQAAEDEYQDVIAGIRTKVSVGYTINKYEYDEKEETLTATEWEPLEISLVAIPADTSVGVGRSLERAPECDDPECDGEPEEASKSKVQSPKSQVRTSQNNQIHPAQTPRVAATKGKTRTLQTRTTMKRDKKDDTCDDPNCEDAKCSVHGDDAEEPTKSLPNAATRAAEMVDFAKIYGEEEMGLDYAADETKSLADLKKDILAKRRQRTKETTPAAEDPKTVASRNGAGLALVTSRARLRNFKGERAHEVAYRAGMFLQAALFGNRKAKTWCKENGIPLINERAHSESDNESGGFLVPDEFENVMIDLREDFGFFRRLANVVPMATETKSRPRRTGGLTAYPIGARGSSRAITESKKGWDRVSLEAKKWGVLSKYEVELAEDAVISLADDIAGEIAYAFAVAEDQAGFNGDGSSTYHGITGILAKIKGLSGTIGNIAGLQVGTGNAYSELTMADFIGVLARLPQYAAMRQPYWVCSRAFWANVMVRLTLTPSGVTAAEVEGARTPRFLGYPVEISQAMPTTEANSQVCALFGVFNLGVMFGDRRGVTIRQTDSNDTDFEEDLMSIKGTERFDINVHDVGNASGTASARVPGPIVGLITAAS